MKHTYLDSEKSEDVALINGYLNGDGSGFEKLYRKYHHRMYIYCLKALHNEQDAQDVTQDIFIKAYENIDSLKNPGLVWSGCLSTLYNTQYIIHNLNHLDLVRK